MKILLSKEFSALEIEDIVNILYEQSPAIPMTFDYLKPIISILHFKKEYATRAIGRGVVKRNSENKEERDIYLLGTDNKKVTYIKVPGDDVYQFDKTLLDETYANIEKIFGPKFLPLALEAQLFKKNDWLSSNGNIAVIFNVGTEDLADISETFIKERLFYFSKKKKVKIEQLNIENEGINGSSYSEIKKELELIISSIRLAPCKISELVKDEEKEVEQKEGLKRAEVVEGTPISTREELIEEYSMPLEEVPMEEEAVLTAETPAAEAGLAYGRLTEEALDRALREIIDTSRLRNAA